MSAAPIHVPETPPAAGPSRALKAGIVLAAAGGAVCLLTLCTGPGAVRRFFFDYLWGALFAWSVVLGSLFLVALLHLTGAVWAVGIRRTAEVLAAAVGLVAVLFVPVLAGAVLGPRAGLYPWADPALAHADHLIAAKSAYLNVPFFVLRAILFFALWIGYAHAIAGRSLRAGAGADGRELLRCARGASAHFMIVFAFSVTFAAIDWIMSLDPRWFSTLYGVYVWSGMVLAALACVTLAVLWSRRAGVIDPALARPDHLYNLGALLFAFVCFWGYLAASQYMLVWYANLPEETAYFAHRIGPGWAPLSVALPVVRFALPFFILLSRRAKMHPLSLAAASLLIIAGQWLDLHWLVMPHFAADAPALGWQELGPVLLMTGVLLLWFARSARARAMVPDRDPRLEACRGFHL